MSFIIKNSRTTTTPTTTVPTTTTTTTTTTTLPVISILDNDVYVGGFGNGEVNNYGLESPTFAEFPANTNGIVGNIEMEVIRNDNTYINNLDGTYSVTIDMEIRFRNIAPSSDRIVTLPRVAIDLPFSGLIATTDTFKPLFGDTDFRVYTPSRIVCEYNDMYITGGDIVDFVLDGTVELTTIGTTPPLVDITSDGFDPVLDRIYMRAHKNNPSGALSVTTLDVLFEDTQLANHNILNGNTSQLYNFDFTLPPFESEAYSGSIIKVVDMDVPHYLVDPNNSVGYVETFKS